MLLFLDMNKELQDLLSHNCVIAAKELIGWQFFVREANGTLTGGTIVETEAYSQDDKASHSYNGKTKRNEVMFGPAGRLYVYFTYGMHWCANIVTGPSGHGEAMLLRSILPEENIELMRKRRNHRPDNELVNGPAKLCQALAITGDDNKATLNEGRFILQKPKNKPSIAITATTRIGIRNDTGKLWRFVEDSYILLP